MFVVVALVVVKHLVERYQTRKTVLFPNSEKRVENTVRSGVCLTTFEVFEIVLKHCLSCLIFVLKRN